MSKIPFVSVIIPVYNDLMRLKMCLTALQAQTYPKRAYEVIVVDNGSDESVESLLSGCCQVRFCFESHPGSYAARNKGLSLARGGIIAFTDSDCIPSADWIEKGVAILLHTPHCGIIGGEVEIFFKDPKNPTATELYDSVIVRGLDQKKFIEQESFAVTANLFTFKKVLEHVGTFDKNLKSGGDQKWGRQVASAGYKLAYAADVHVRHPARSSYAQLIAKQRRIERGFFAQCQKKKPPLKLNYRSIRARISPLPPVFKIMRIEGIMLKTKVKMLALWLIIRYIQIEENLRRTIKLSGKSVR